MLRHRLQQGVCSGSLGLRHLTLTSRSLSVTPPANGYTSQSRSSSSHSLSKLGNSQFLGNAPAFRSKYSSSPGPEALDFDQSQTSSEKFSIKKDRSGPRWRRREYTEKADNHGRYRDKGRLRKMERTQDHLYDNYKPRASPQKEINLSETRTPSQVDASFDVLQAIRNAFPHVEKPTSIQTRLIPAIMQGQDVILMDETGSGKTFGSVLALLPEISRPHTGITTLYIVPHRDLAYQIESWCQKLVAAQPSTTIDPSAVVRVIARPNATPEIFADIRKNPPRILVSTPGALIDAMQIGRLRLEATLRRIVIDEVDAVMKIPLRYHQVQLRNRHTPEVVQVIDKLLRLMWEHRRPKPQMVMMSATLKTHVRSWLFRQKGWMAERVVRLHGIQEKIESGVSEPSEHARVTHSAVVVEADGRLRNIGNEQGRQADSKLDDEHGILSENPETVLEFLDQEGDGGSDSIDSSSDSYQTTTELVKGHTIPPSILEAIATSVAFDVSHRALLVIPAGVSIDPVVKILRGFGVETRTLNLRDEIEHVSTRLENDEHTGHAGSPSSNISQPPVGQDEEFVPNPTLLVATTTAVRGVDIPTLSHVYIVGGLESEEAYRHVAGRVGRFGMPGTVISFVGADGAEMLLGGTGERRMQKTFERIGVQNTPFPHI